MGLKITRRKGEGVFIGPLIYVEITGTGSEVQLDITAPDGVDIRRAELPASRRRVVRKPRRGDDLDPPAKAA